MWDERVNTAIDEVARQMTEEALATDGADFRRRVLARIASNDEPRASWRAAFVLSPIAVAAAIAIAVFIVRRPDPAGPGIPQPAPTVASPADSAGLADARGASTRAEAEGPARQVARGVPLDGARGRQPRERGPERAAPQKMDVLEPALQVDSITVTPLTVGALAPGPIQIERLDAVAPIDVAPLEIVTDMQRRQE